MTAAMLELEVAAVEEALLVEEEVAMPEVASGWYQSRKIRKRLLLGLYKLPVLTIYRRQYIRISSLSANHPMLKFYTIDLRSTDANL